MTDRLSRKILVRRPSRAHRSDGAELELVSTQMLKVILSSRDGADRRAIARTVSTDRNGVLARNPVNGRFELIDDDELQAILESNRDMPKISMPADATLEPLRDYVDDDHLSLVSTRALRRVLERDDAGRDDDAGSARDVAPAVGFNPYESA